MSETLGEKLRQAREERGISISEVAEQTRISPLYLESIENDDYRGLPGGIFNKGFVKSFAKYVGVDEQEALLDYSRLISQTEAAPESEPRTYRPEVLTDGHSRGSGLGTIIAAVIILALMTGGVLFLVNYLRRPSQPAANNNSNTTNSNLETVVTTETKPAGGTPEMATVKIEVGATTKTTVLTTVDAEQQKKTDVTPSAPLVLEPKEKLTLNFLRWNAPNLTLTINGKTIALPSTPTDPKAQRIEFTISKDNLAQIWTSGSIVGGPSASTDPNTNTAMPTTSPAPRPSSTPAKTANTAANTVTNTARPASTPKPAANTAKPPTMTTTRPTPKP